MIYRAYRFPDQQDFLDALAETQPLEFVEIGLNDLSPGWHVNAIWGGAEPNAWINYTIPSEEAPGWWAGVGFTDPIQAVPNKVTPRQLREALLEVGILEVVEAIVAASDRATQIRWEYAIEFERSHPQWDAMAALMDPPMTSADIDAVFQLALTK